MTNDAGVASGRRLRVAAAFLPSPVFLLVIACFVASGTVAWRSGFGTGRGAQLAVFAFVASGWLISLCLHEFGHAFSAWRFGDRDVAVRVYLTLNPAKYANVALSVVLPMVFLLLGGIGLPGGAVYINRGVIQGKWRHSFVSAVGPLVNLVLALALIAVISRNGTGTARRRALPRPRTSAWCFTRTSGPRYPSWRSSRSPRRSSTCSPCQA